MSLNYGLAISKAGYDVKTTAITNQVFNSSYNKFKIVSQGSSTVSVGATAGTSYTTNIAHGLSYTPGHVEFIQHRDANKSYFSTGNAGDGVDGFGYGRADATNLTLVVVSSGTSYTATFYYYIFADPGA